MANSPVTPSDFCQLTPTAGTDPCEAVKRIFFEQPALICRLLQHMFNEDGSINDDFLNQTFPVPVGTVWDYAGQNVPSGWLECNGQEVSREDYSGLFSIIGTIFGAGDGVSTFNVPDLAGKVAVGRDQSDSDFGIGSSGGAKTHTLTEAQLPAHVHSMDFDNSTSGGGHATVVGNGANTFMSQNTSSVGGGQAHNNLQPYLGLMKIIRT